MQHKKQEYFTSIEEYINQYIAANGESPTVRDIAAHVGIGAGTVSKYLRAMQEQGLIDNPGGHRRIRTPAARNEAVESIRVPVVGSIACGLPILAEENIEEYVRLPVSLFGRGEYYILHAKGDSMINAGVNDGDLVLVRAQSSASYNQIVVALIDDEATLKRFRPESDHIVLHAENPEYEDIHVSECVIQGVAVKVIKDLS